ncbi:MAG TPA: hypothetical protein VHB97_08360 [Polyangia bacterium]|nr:hypothetical protein [Polyangia bacterium]
MADAPSAPPSGNDGGDDDLATLAPTPRGKNPLVAAAVIALAVVIGWHLRDDARYAFSSRTPADLGDARAAAAGATRGAALDDNRYVTISGQAERRYALYVEPRGVRARQTIFRVLGVQQGLFVVAADTTGRSDLSERWTGRLRHFDAMSYAPSLRKYYATETEVTRYLALDALKAVLSGGAGELRDRMGERIAVRPDQPVVVTVEYPGELKVYLSKDKLPSLADARHELDRIGLAPSAGEETKDEFAFIVPMPDARKNEILGKLSDKELAFQPHEERLTVTRAELRLDGDTLHIGARANAPWAHINAVGVPAPVEIGADAFILLEGEAPAQFWWAPLLLALLVAFAAFNVWYLVRAIRSSRTA